VREGFYSGTRDPTAWWRTSSSRAGGHDATSYDSEKRRTEERLQRVRQRPWQNKRVRRGTGARGLRRTRDNAQFYVKTYLVDNPDLDPVAHPLGLHGLGRILQGMDVIDHIGEEQPTGRTSDRSSRMRR